MYADEAQNAGGDAANPGAGEDAGASAADDAVEAEFEEVKDKKDGSG